MTDSSDRLAHLHTLVLAHHSGQLQVAFHLLPDFLKAVDNGHSRDGVDATQDVQRHVDQSLFASDLAILDDGRGGRVHSQHGVVGVGIVLRVTLISRHNGCTDI